MHCKRSVKLHKDVILWAFPHHVLIYYAAHWCLSLLLLLLCVNCLLAVLAGNINQLILKVDSYAQSLQETQGIIAEFVNPKYKDASKTAFKSSTRLECMMQDYPKALPSSSAVGFTLINQVRFCLLHGNKAPASCFLSGRFNNRYGILKVEQDLLCQ